MKHAYQRYLFIEVHGCWFYWHEHKEMMEKIERDVANMPPIDSGQFLH